MLETVLGIPTCRYLPGKEGGRARQIDTGTQSEAEKN
jgi:hypothetical protein